MRSASIDGAAFRLLCATLLLGALTSSERAPRPARSVGTEMAELQGLMQATRHHPSLVDASTEAGPPIHVDPVVSSGAPRQHEHAPHRIAAK